MKHTYIILLLVCNGVIYQIMAQNEASKWYFGYQCALDFSTDPPTCIGPSSMTIGANASCISDSNGNLLFYSNGNTIWNQQHLVMANGAGITGAATGGNNSIAIKQPGTTNVYYDFVANFVGTGTPTHIIQYSRIDMNLAAGMGSVTSKNALLYSPASPILCATRHCNGNDTWLIGHEAGTNKFFSILITNTGISSLPVISPIGPATIYTVGFSSAGGMGLRISPNGKKLALVSPVLSASSSSLVADLSVFDFDNATGIISNSLSLNNIPFVSGNPQFVGGIEFSPDGSKLYNVKAYGGSVLYQWDLCAGSPSAIVASQYSLSAAGIPSECYMQLGPNGKIYICSINSACLGPCLSVIHQPDASAPGFSLSVNGFQLTTGFAGIVSLPQFESSLLKSPLTYTQELGCNSIKFAPVPVAVCSAVGSTVTGVSWDFGDPGSGSANTSTLAGPSHTFSSAGVYLIKRVINYATCAPDTFRQNITTVNPTVTINSASASCSGLGTATVTVLQGGSGAPLAYTWSPSGQTNSVATNLSPGIYSISVINTGGNCALTTTVAISAPIQITAAVSTTLSCSTASAQIIPSGGSGNYSYLWTAGNMSTSLVQGLVPGNYSITLNDNTHQCSFTKTISIASLPSPTLSITGNFSICAKESTTLTASGATSYTWSSGVSGNTVALSPPVTSTISVKGTGTLNTCQGTTTVVVNVSKCLSLENSNEAKQKIRIYPNPSSGKFTLECEIVKTEITIYDHLGKLVYSGFTKGDKTQIDLSELPNGIYLVELKNKELKQVLKLVKEE